MKSKSLFRIITGIVCVFCVSNSYARIKLITLPVREHVEIQLENENTTIIEEERIVPLRKGINDIDFSWHNSAIRPETIVFRVLEDEHPIKTSVLSVSYPPNESALTWKVAASQNGSVRVRITYAIERLDKTFHYIAHVDQDEKKMDLVQYIRVNNQSRESFRDARMNTGSAKEVVLPLGLDETQEFINHSYHSVEIEKTYTVNASELGYRNRAQDKLNVFMHYLIKNDQAHQLGKHSLAPGKFRIYQQDKAGTAVFVGEDWGKYTATDDESSLFIGQARDIVVKRTIERQKRQRVNGNLYNIDVVVKYEIENFKQLPVKLIIEESIVSLRNEVFSSGSSYQHSAIEWQLGDETSFANKPLKKQTNSQKIAYQLTLPGRTTTNKAVKLEKKLNINFKNEW